MDRLSWLLAYVLSLPVSHPHRQSAERELVAGLAFAHRRKVEARRLDAAQPSA
jgi:hypothetical protein